MNSFIYPLVSVVSLLFAVIALQLLRRQQLFDLPNERSSHSTPVPRGGGVSFAILYLLLLSGLALAGELPVIEALVLIVGGGVLALIGFLDDRFSLSSKSRLLVQLVCAAISVLSFYYYQLSGGSGLLWLWLGGLVLASIWWVNLFNFLDGIDGYAISEAVLISTAAAGLCLQGAENIYPQLFLLLAASLIGFGVLNWAPAKLFMGDVGSYFLGFILAMLAVLTVREQLISPLVWLILTALFWIDASVTLLRRMLRGERWYQAHRSHAYQILSRRWQSHQRVSLLAIAINTVWLIPLSFVCQWLLDTDQFGFALGVFVCACVPIACGVYWLKSGVDNG
ncbi:MAG: glycosyltransferase family 4 protein [Halopseudomonas sp.]